MWGKFIFREIVPHERLVFVVSFSEEGGGMTRHLHQGWPLQMLSTVTFADAGPGTIAITVTWPAYEATEAERNAFEDGEESMRQGWTGTFDRLDDYG